VGGEYLNVDVRCKLKGTKLTFIKNVLKIILLNQLVFNPKEFREDSSLIQEIKQIGLGRGS